MPRLSVPGHGPERELDESDGPDVAAARIARVARVRLDPPDPRGIDPDAVAAIPADRRRDHLLFRLMAATGLRVGEALPLYIGDLDRTPDEKHLRSRRSRATIRIAWAHEVMAAHRGWSLAKLAATRAVIFPEHMVDLLASVGVQIEG